MMTILVIVALVAAAFGLYTFFSRRPTAAQTQVDALLAHGFSPCPDRQADIERRFSELSTTTGQGGDTIRDPFCAEVSGHSVFFFTGVPRRTGRTGTGRPRPAFMLPYSAAVGRAQVWLTSSAIEANPMLTQKIKTAISVLDEETPGSRLVTLDVPDAWAARHVIGAIGEPGRTLEQVLGQKTSDVLADAGEHGFFRAVFGDGWLVLEHFPYAGAFSAPHGSLAEQIAFVQRVAAFARP